MPDLVDPIRLVEQGRDFQGVIQLEPMARIRDLVLNRESAAVITLSFRKEEGVSALFGSIEAELQLECQRCLKSLVLPVSHDFQLGLIASIKEAELLPDSFEPLLVGDKAIRVQRLIEDELLLLLPMVPKHDRCDVGLQNTPVEETKDNPFSVLTNLKEQLEKK